MRWQAWICIICDHVSLCIHTNTHTRIKPHTAWTTHDQPFHQISCSSVNPFGSSAAERYTFWTFTIWHLNIKLLPCFRPKAYLFTFCQICISGSFSSRGRKSDDHGKEKGSCSCNWINSNDWTNGDRKRVTKILLMWNLLRERMQDTT